MLARRFHWRKIMAATPEEIQKAVVEKSVDGRIKCAECFQIAKAIGAPLKEVGDACNAAKVKIINCQLGCF